jgi:ABC-type amino acid transport system permease subunit
METNAPFYIVSLYVAIFRNVIPRLMQTYYMFMGVLSVIISKLLSNPKRQVLILH